MSHDDASQAALRSRRDRAASGPESTMNARDARRMRVRAPSPALVRVLLVSDAIVIRRLCARALSAEPDIDVVGEAPDGYAARDVILAHRPDVLVLDLEMPHMDGLTFLRRVMKHHPMPIVVVSSLTGHAADVAMEALQAGAVEVVCKPTNEQTFEQMTTDLTDAIRQAGSAAMRGRAPASAGRRTTAESAESATRPKVAATRDGAASLIAIGGSTGGTVVIEGIMRHLPRNSPPIVIVQHMPAYMTPLFARRLDRMSEVDAREARDGDLLVEGTALLAPGGKHLVVERCHDGMRVRVQAGAAVSGHRPSVDVLFESIAQSAGRGAVGLILTGMGKDGARGLRAMRDAGARTLAQDQASCVVYGMPKVAVDLEAVDEVVDLAAIPERLVQLSTGA